MDFISVCISIKNGKDVNQSKDKKKYMVSRIETISSEVFDFNSVQYTDDEVDEEYFWKKGDIALSHINSLEHLGKTAYFDNNTKIIHGINILRIQVNEDIAYSKFVYLVTKLEHFKKEVQRLCKRAINQASISIGDLSTIKIPIPPLDVQEKVIAECEKIEEKYENTRMRIEDYKLQIQKIFEDLEVIKTDRL